MRRSELVQLLLAKAAQDEYVMDRLIEDPDSPLEVFGFHAQQATEKMLKAGLTAKGIRFPRTHRIVDLIDLAKAKGISLPAFVEELRELTPYAVEFRYDLLPQEGPENLDRVRIREHLRRLREWLVAHAGE